jgi:hypothetical protein
MVVRRRMVRVKVDQIATAPNAMKRLRSCEHIDSVMQVETYCVMSTPLTRKKEVGALILEMAVL